MKRQISILCLFILALASAAHAATVEFRASNYKRLAGETDDSPRIQRMMNAAGKQADGTGTWPVLIFPGTSVYTISNPIAGHPRVTHLRGDGLAVFVGKGNDAFVWEQFWRGRVENLSFQGKFGTCLRVPTCNGDAAHQVFQGLEFGDGTTLGIDQVSFDASRSTVTVVRDCKSRAGELGRFYGDMLTIEGGDVRFTGGEYVLTIDSKATIKGTMFTPAVASTPVSAWIKLVSSEQGRGLVIDGCRFGGECQGGMPVVESWAEGNASFLSDYGYQTSIKIRDTMVSPASANVGRRCVVMLHKMPNLVSLENVNGSTPADGFVGAADDFQLPTGASAPLPWANIKIDDETLRLQMWMAEPKPVADAVRGFLK